MEDTKELLQHIANALEQIKKTLSERRTVRIVVAIGGEEYKEVTENLC